MKKITALLVLFTMLVFTCVSHAESLETNEMSSESTALLYINGKLLEGDDQMIGSYLFPMRSILEKIGAVVTWDENTGYTYFEFRKKIYVCRMFEAQIEDDLGIVRRYMICETDKVGSLYNDDYIQLNPMSANGMAVIINDRTYLPKQTMVHLLKAFKYDVVYTQNDQIINITPIRRFGK